MDVDAGVVVKTLQLGGTDMYKLSAVVTLSILLMGCPSDIPEAVEPDVVEPEAVELPGIEAPVEHIDLIAYESMVVEHPDGFLFVAGFGGPELGEPPTLWKSSDDGRTWDRVDVGSAADGADGNSDVDLAVGADGTLYFVALGFNNEAFEGLHIAMGASPDAGASWTWTYLSQDRNDDRPWVKVAPDGTAHVIWNDGNGVSHATSRDRGQTWVEQSRVHPRGGSSHLAIGPSGEIAVRITPLSASANQFDPGLELIAVSTDGGMSWSKHPSPATPVWDPTFEWVRTNPGQDRDESKGPILIPRWVEPLAWDGAGSLYHLWSEGQDMWLARSTDQGETWQRWTVAHDDGGLYYPYLVARAAGELAASWFSGRGETLTANVARIDLTSETEPTVRILESFQPDTWRTRGDGPQTRYTCGEYSPVIYLADGGLGVSTTISDAETQRFGFSWRRFAPSRGR